MAAEDKNPYDLAGRADGPDAPPAPRDWTPEEQAEKLAGYLEVSPDLWEAIRGGTHLRYFTKKDGFRVGGFVQRNPYFFKPQGSRTEKRFMRLQNGFDSKARGYAAWPVAYEDLDRVYIKPDAGALVTLRALETAVKGLNENIQKLAAHAKKLEARLAALEPEGRRG